MTLDKNFGEELLHKIKDEHLQPKPRWQFLLKNYVIWGVGALALFLGSIAMSLIILMTRYNDWGLYQRLDSGHLQFWLFVIPFFWIICLIAFVVLVYFDIKHTKKGYRYSPVTIMAVIVAASVLLGGIFDIIGLGARVDNELGRRVPFYDRIIDPHIEFWSHPNEGRITGMIISHQDGNYMLIDRDQVEWDVETQGLKQTSGSGLVVGHPARFLGEIDSDHKFKASETLPFFPGQGFFERFGPPPTPGLNPERENDDQPVSCHLPQPSTSLNFLLEKYPELKTAFSNDLLSDKENLKKTIKTDPELIKNLQLLKIDQKIIDQISQ